MRLFTKLLILKCGVALFSWEEQSNRQGDRNRVRRKDKREWEYRVKISLIVCWVVMYMSHWRFNGCNPNFFIIIVSK